MRKTDRTKGDDMGLFEKIALMHRAKAVMRLQRQGFQVVNPDREVIPEIVKVSFPVPRMRK